MAPGDTYVRPRVARLLAATCQRRAAPEDRRARYDSLSAREQAVVRLVAAGYNGTEIGRQLGVSPKTVDTYKQRIEENLGLSHRTEYVQFALAYDLLTKAALEPLPVRRADDRARRGGGVMTRTRT